MLAKKQQTLNLPREKEHRVWSKDILRQKVGVDQTIEMYLTRDAIIKLTGIRLRYMNSRRNRY